MGTRIAVLAAALVLASPAMAEDQPLPRVIYGETMPRVLYGPESAPPPEPPRRPDPAPRPQPQANGGGTTLESGWVPVGPPVWAGTPPGWHRPPRPIWGPPPLRLPDQPMPQGSMSGATPDGRSSFGRR